MWQNLKGAYLRFSDDIAVFHEERESLENARDLIERILSELKLSTNKSKSSITHVSGGIVYLGFYMDVKGKGPSQKSIDQIHEKLENLTPVRKTDNITERLKDTDVQIRGWYNYYKSLTAITPPNILSLLSLVRLSMEFNEIQYAKDLLRQHEIFSHTHPEVYFRIAELFRELGMKVRATREYARALELNPSMIAAKDRIRALQNQESDLNQAIEKTKLVLHHNPHYREGYEKLAHYYAKLGLYGHAEKANQKALELDNETDTGFSVENTSRDSGPGPDGLDFEKSDQELFLELFQGRADAHGRQWIDEFGKCGFIRVERPLKRKDIYKHLNGEETIAVYPVTVRDTVNFIVFDVDISKRILLKCGEDERKGLLNKSHEDIIRIREACENLGFVMCIEDSGYKGRHGWLFFTEEVRAAKAIFLGNEILKKAGEPSEGLVWELFPKGKIGRDLNLIKLPLGINRKNNRRCAFLNDNGESVADPAAFLKRRIKKNDIRSLDFFGDDEQTDDQGISYNKDEILAPSGLKDMINRCGIIHHLVLKARDTNYLNHYERISLLYTLTFAGEEGCKFLHKTMGYCMNYDFHHTQRYIDKRKPSPISCARIMENFPELGDSFCGCKFRPPPGSYPSPVLYILQSEVRGITPETMFSRENVSDLSKRKPNNDATPAHNEKQPPVLNFENIFSEELENKAEREREPGNGGSLQKKNKRSIKTGQYDSKPETHVKPVTNEPSTEMAKSNMQMPRKKEMHGSPVHKMHTDQNKSELWELFLKYLDLEHQNAKTKNELEKIKAELDQRFGETANNILVAEKGTLKRIREKDGTARWELVTTM